MRSVVMRPGHLSIEERPIPVPGSGEVLIRTLACGICGSDLHLFRHAQDYYDQALQAGADKVLLDRGVVLGHEFVGEIVEFGADKKTDLRIGQRVCSTPFLPERLADIPMGATPWLDGAYAEYFLLEEALLIPVPDHIDTITAALVEPLAIGIHAINRADLTAEPECVVIGCGPIGLAVITALAAKGIQNIVAADFSAPRRELATRFGASVTTDPNDASVFDALSSSPRKAVAVFECSGAKNMIRFCTDGAPPQSEIIIAGISHGEESFVPATAISKELSLRFVSFYTHQEFTSALELLGSGRVDSTAWITLKIGLDDVPDAFAALASTQKHTKILVLP